MKKNDPLIYLAIIVLYYSIIAFYNLGSTSSPKTYADIKPLDRIVMDFGEVVDFTRVNSFKGKGEILFVYEASDDGETWNVISLIATNYGTFVNDVNGNRRFQTPFTWCMAGLNSSGRYLRITSRYDLQLYEVAVYNGNKLISIKNSSHPAVADEQTAVQRFNTNVSSLYYDEMFYPLTAYEISKKIPVSFLTHPPLAMVFMAASIKVFGMNPFAVRLPGVIAGILMIPVLYLLADKLFRNKKIALIAAALLAFDFMHFSMTRIAMLDPFPVLFGIVIFYFLADYIRRMQSLEINGHSRSFLPLIWAGISFGMAFSSKWSGLYNAPGILLLLLFTWYHIYKTARKRKLIRNVILQHFFICIAAFILIPSVIYFLSYIPQMQGSLGGKTPMQYFIDYQKFMFGFHFKFDLNHAYASTAIEWPINLKSIPAFVYAEYIMFYNRMYVIFIMGNPFIWWTGLIAIIALSGWALYSRRLAPVFITAAFLTSYIVWVFVTRTSFIIYYFTCVPFIILAICYWVSFSWNKLEPAAAGNKIVPLHWTNKIPAPVWSILFGLITAASVYVFSERAKIAGESIAAQRVLSTLLAAILAVMLLVARIIWNNKKETSGVNIEKVITVPSGIWIAIVVISFIFFVCFYPFIAGMPVTTKYSDIMFSIFKDYLRIIGS
ncbi:MAG: phospholipid carrier-dependent glycosyltransferase [Treponema sp.]|nr:phospholipid carrier-dependent glycosyltransferase [Treponema sp.]